jgi:putative DNA primase/helicase
MAIRERAPRPQRQEHAAHYAASLRERFEQKGILRELAGYPNFVVWRYRVIDGQRKKPPFDPNTHTPASPIDPRTWGTIESALSAVATGQFQGIGFMLTRSPFTGIDLDHCIEKGKILPWAKEIVAAMDTYTEYSPSWNRAAGTGGVHLLVAGKPPGSKKAGDIEIYGEKHYLTITTNHLEGTPTTINSRQEALDTLYRTIAPPVGEQVYQNTRGGRGVPLTGLPEEAAQDDVLQRLLRGDITGYASQSSADFALIMKLLHWTGDNKALTRQLFLSSPLGQRKKATRPTGATIYVDMTIENVIKKRRNPPMQR